MHKPLKLSLIVGFVVFLSVFFLPFIARDVAVYAMLQLGAKEAHLKSIQINWFTGKFTISGLEAYAPDRQALTVGELSFDLDVKALWQQRLLVEQLTFRDGQLNVNLSDAGLYVGPLLIPLSQASDELRDENATNADPSADDSSPWQVGIDHVAFRDLTGELDMEASPLVWVIDRLSVSNFRQWDKAALTQAELSGSINKAPFFVSTEGSPLMTEKPIIVNTEVKVDALSLSKLSEFRPISRVLPFPLNGHLHSDLTLHVSYSAATEQLLVDTDGEFGWRGADLLVDGQKVKWKDVTWRGKSTSDMVLEQTLVQQLDGELSLSGLAYQAQEQNAVAKLGSLTFSGSHRVKASLAEGAGIPDITSDYGVNLQQLALTQVPKDAPGQTTSVSLSELSLTGQADISPHNGQQLGVKGQVSLEDMHLKQPGTQASLASLTLAHDIEGMQVFHGASKLDAASHIDLNVTGMELLATEGAQRQSVSVADMSFAAKAQASNGSLALADIQNLLLNHIKLAAVTETGADTSMGLDQISLEGVSLKQSEQTRRSALTLNHFVMSDLALLADASLDSGAKQEAFLSLKSLELDSVDIKGLPEVQWRESAEFLLTDAELTASPVVLKSLNVLARRDADGDVWPLSVITQPSNADVSVGTTSETDQPTDVSSQPLASDPQPLMKAVSLGGLSLTSSLLHWQDTADSNAEPVEVKLLINGLNLGEIQPLIATATTPVDLDATLNEYGKVVAKADTALFSPLAKTQWKLDVTAVDIPSFNGYIEAASGYFIQQGQVNVTSEGSLENEVIGSKNNITLSQVEVNQRDASKAQELTSTLTMPLETVIVLLQDDSKKLSLDLPVNGPIDEIEIGYQGIVSLIAKKAIKEAALSYFSTALQPYGALVTLTRSALNASNNGAFIRLKPVEFAPAMWALTADNRDYLDTVVAMMTKKTSLVLKICPVYGRDDEQALARQREAQLQQAIEEKAANVETESIEPPLSLEAAAADLIKKRESAVKAYLAQQLSAERLFSCYVAEIKATDERGNVDLGF